MQSMRTAKSGKGMNMSKKIEDFLEDDDDNDFAKKLGGIFS